MARKKIVTIDIQSSVIEVEGTLYPVIQIAGVKKVQIKRTTWEIISRKRRYAILIKTLGTGYFILVGSYEEELVNEVFSKIKNAINSQSSGNFTYVDSVSLRGDVVNQSGNFSVGYNKGKVDLGEE